MPPAEPGRDRLIAVPVTARQVAVIERAAELAGLSVAEYARSAAADRATADLRIIEAGREDGAAPMLPGTSSAAGAGRGAELAALIAARAVRRSEPATLADLCEVSVEVLAVTGAAVRVAADAEHRVLAHATDPVSRQLDELQLTFGEGPCTDAWELGGPVTAKDLRAVEAHLRWSGYTPAALAAGARAVFAFPLRSGAISAGTLQLYRREPGPLADGRLADALTLAELALDMILAHVHPGTPGSAGTGGNAGSAGGDAGGEQVGLPWHGDGLGADRAEIFQATGMVSVQSGVGLMEALTLLRRYAVAHRRPLSRVALEVVGRELRFPATGRKDDHGD
ncbi:GAF and ANTAR domain-containing protein [Actinomadura gamaensis]|uniref:GAF and ANTAR domain-containing protein n=1 Tax=Actinomadura gamaensis TaxID=1763541 RepID=A0ABV9TTQ2_9ACTN